MSNTQSPKKTAAPVAAVPDEEQPTVSPEIQARLNAEQDRLNSATLQAQVNYLSARVAELAAENLELRKQIGEDD